MRVAIKTYSDRLTPKRVRPLTAIVGEALSASTVVSWWLIFNVSGVKIVKVGNHYASNKALPAIASPQSVNPMAERRLGTVG